MSDDSENTNGGSRARSFLEKILSASQTMSYYVVTLCLIAGIVVLTISVGSVFVTDILRFDALQATLDILDRVLLITIFVELLITIEVLVREGQIVAEPFILVALVAVVRRILLITAEVKQNHRRGQAKPVRPGDVHQPRHRTRGVDGARGRACRRPVGCPPRRTCARGAYFLGTS